MQKWLQNYFSRAKIKVWQLNVQTLNRVSQHRAHYPTNLHIHYTYILFSAMNRKRSRVISIETALYPALVTHQYNIEGTAVLRPGTVLWEQFLLLFYFRQGLLCRWRWLKSAPQGKIPLSYKTSLLLKLYLITPPQLKEGAR